MWMSLTCYELDCELVTPCYIMLYVFHIQVFFVFFFFFCFFGQFCVLDGDIRSYLTETPSGHVALIQRRISIDATLLHRRCINIMCPSGILLKKGRSKFHILSLTLNQLFNAVDQQCMPVGI